MRLPFFSCLTSRSGAVRSLNGFHFLVFAFGVALGTLPALAQDSIELPPQSGTYSGNVRGYWFTAPKDFAITGVEIPTDASEGNQSIAIVRFNGAPDFFPSTTNDFEVLFLIQDGSASGSFPIFLEISAGDQIGVLGSRGGVTSYGPAPSLSSIDGLPINLFRLGMQSPLASTAPRDLFVEEGGSIGRVLLFYGPLVEASTLPKRKDKKKKKQRRSDAKGVRTPRSVTPY